MAAAVTHANGTSARDAQAKLARRASAGDMRALEQLLLALVPRVRNLVRYLVRRDSEVDDAAQAALLAVARGLHTFAGRAPFSAWADRVVARATFAAIRSRPRVEATPRGLGSVPAADGGGDYLARRWLVRLLDRLSPDQRAALVLHHVLGFSVPEIAAALGISGETVRSRLRLGRARLRAMGGAVDENDDD